MPDIQSTRTGFIGLDLHSHCVVIVGLDSEGHQALGPRRIRWPTFRAGLSNTSLRRMPWSWR